MNVKEKPDRKKTPPSPYIIFNILHPIPQVFKLGRFIYQKHDKETNWRTTQQQAQTTRKLSKSDNYETHQIKIYTSPNLLNDNNFKLQGYYWSRYFVNPTYKTL